MPKNAGYADGFSTKFWNGIDLIRKFLNFAGSAVYAVMLILMVVIWVAAGGDIW